MEEFHTLRTLTPDGKLILLSRGVRLFAFGALSVILVLHFAEQGWSATEIGRLLALTMFGDAAVTLWVTLQADRLGRARMLGLGAALMMLAGLVLPATGNVWLVAPVVFFGVCDIEVRNLIRQPWPRPRSPQSGC